MVISNTLATVWIAYRGSVVKCARSQVRPFHDDDEAAHEHVTDHMRDLVERLLHEGDFSYEDEPPVGSPPAPGETQRQDPTVKDRWMWTPKMRGKTRPISLEQPTSSPVNASPDATPQEAEREIITTREEEPMNLFLQSPQLPKTESQH